MKPWAVLPCLLLSACDAPRTVPAVKASGPVDERAFWEERTRAIRLSWSRPELDAFLDSIRTPDAHRLNLLDGGAFNTNRAVMTYFSLYSLDDTFSLYVIWEDPDSRKGIASTEVIGLPDALNRIDPELREAVAAIHRSPSPQRGLEFSSVRLIRAVNALQPLGKEKALKALWAYYRLARDLSVGDRRKHHTDEYRILPIVHLLFESPPGGMPGFILGAGDVAAPEVRAWPLFPIALVQDVPFMMVSGYMLAGMPQDAADHLRLKLGPIRPAPLAPQVTPLEAADELTQSEGWNALHLPPGELGRKRWHVRGQALRAVSSVFTPRTEETSNDCCVNPTEAQWGATVGRAKSSGLLWSPETQDFILGR